MESFWRCFESFLQSFHGELRVFLRVFIESFFRGFSRMSFESFLERFHGELREFLDFSRRVSRGFRPEGLAIAQIIANMISQRGLGKGKGKGKAQEGGYNATGPAEQQDDADSDGVSGGSGDVCEDMAAGAHGARPVATGKPIAKPKAKKSKKKAKN